MQLASLLTHVSPDELVHSVPRKTSGFQRLGPWSCHAAPLMSVGCSSLGCISEHIPYSKVLLCDFCHIEKFSIKELNLK